MKEPTPLAERRKLPAPLPRLPLPDWRLVLALALPVLAQQGLVFIVNQSDRFLAGHLKVVTPAEEAQIAGQMVAAAALASSADPGASLAMRVAPLRVAW